MLSDTAVDMSTNIRATNRELKLSAITGGAKDVTGVVDKRLFSGGQSLMVKMDPQTNLWSFRYTSNALLPEPLQGQFTSFSKAYEHAEGYFKRRNVKITEVID